MKNLILRSSDRGSILDVGAGRGDFLKSLDVVPAFQQRVATDLQEHVPTASDEIKWLHCDLNEPWSLIESQGFDWVVGIEILEHLENPRHFIRECRRVLRKNGTLILTTPNNQSYRSLLSLFFRGHFVDFGGTNYPAHITALLKTDLERILAENKFELIEIGYSPWGTVPFFTSLNWESLTFGCARGKRFGSHLYLMARKTND